MLEFSPCHCVCRLITFTAVCRNFPFCVKAHSVSRKPYTHRLEWLSLELSHSKERKLDILSDLAILTWIILDFSFFLPIFYARSGAEGPDVSVTTPPVSGGAVQTGPADAGHSATGASKSVIHPDSHSGRDRSVWLWGAPAEGFTPGDSATQLHEQTWYVLESINEARMVKSERLILIMFFMLNFKSPSFINMH